MHPTRFYSSLQRSEQNTILEMIRAKAQIPLLQGFQSFREYLNAEA
jgi:hypothetical protein